MLLMILLFAFIFIFYNFADAAKILFISPSLSASLLLQTGRMADLLVENGHDVTFWIPEYTHGHREQNGSKLAKIERMNDVDWKLEQTIIEYCNVSDENTHPIWHRFGIMDAAADYCEAMLKRKDELKKLKDYKFDIAFTDMIDLCWIGVVKYLDIPTHIWISTGPLHDTFNYDLGIPSPLSYVPVMEENFNVRPKMTFWTKLDNIVQYMLTIYVHWDNTANEQHLFYKYVDPNFPDLYELTMQTALTIVNDHPFIEPARPILHKVVYIGGLGIDKPKPLEEPLKKILDRAKKGAILVSLGSLTSTKDLNEDKRKALYNTFAKYSDYMFIVKVSVDDDRSSNVLKNIPNVKLFHWVPQTDLLGDLRIKLFITHAGANSLLESVIRAVPVITVPLFFDQHRNAYAAEYKGFAYVLRKEEITEETVDRALKEVLYNPKYKKTAERLASLYADQPFTPEETLIKWVDFVAKHGNMSELIPEGARLNFVQYFCLDVIFLGLIFIFVSVYTVVKIVKRVIFSISAKEKVE